MNFLVKVRIAKQNKKQWLSHFYVRKYEWWMRWHQSSFAPFNHANTIELTVIGSMIYTTRQWSIVWFSFGMDRFLTDLTSRKYILVSTQGVFYIHKFRVLMNFISIMIIFLIDWFVWLIPLMKCLKLRINLCRWSIYKRLVEHIIKYGHFIAGAWLKDTPKSVSLKYNFNHNENKEINSNIWIVQQ